MANWICPECRTRFPFVAGRRPECPACGYSIKDRSNGGIAAPFVSHAKHKNPDVIYRAEERASIARAESAAELAGVPVADMSALVMTNQQDNLRAGDVTAPKISASNEVARAMAAAPPPAAQAAPLIGNAGTAAGLYFSQGVNAGPHANMGARIQQRVRDNHTHGADGRQTGVKSDMPANEIANPLYRRRV